MFSKKWREHWGLKEDPFNCEDADKDAIFARVDASATHSGFDRVFGDPRMPAPGIVFGEKGSGKSALRLMMCRQLEEFNEANPQDKVFIVDYINFNNSLEQFRRAAGVSGDNPQAVKKVTQRWSISDHLDGILSLGVTKLVDLFIASQKKSKTLSRKQILDLLLFTSIYYNSDQLTMAEAVSKLRPLIGGRSYRSPLLWTLWILLSLTAVFIGILPLLFGTLDASANIWHGVGLGGLIAIWGWAAWCHFSVYLVARKTVRNVKILPRNPTPLSSVLRSLPPKERREFILPTDSDEDIRYQILRRFLGLLSEFEFKGLYVLMDRIDEPSMLSGNTEGMRLFTEKILDIKLLQYPQLGIKLFLPIELDGIYRNASSEQIKRMRLDKSNLIPELKWSGQELFEVANQRMQVCQLNHGSAHHLAQWFEEDFDFDHLRQTLNTLATPRHAFGFLASLFTDYVKDLPNELADDDPRWRIPRTHFDIVRAAWIDQSGVARRVLN